GAVALTESGTATGGVQGPGSMLASLLTNGSASVKVIYSYTPAAVTNTPSPCMHDGSLSGFVYLDNNQNGVRDAADAAPQGVTVTLQGNGLTTPATTDGNGAYSFTNLAPGTYTVTETQPAGLDQGTNNIGNLGGTVSGDTFTVPLAMDANGINYNFGEII